MKKRKGFVSNSSSTSYVISTAKDITKLPYKIEIEVDLTQFIDNTFDDKETLEKYLESNYGESLALFDSDGKIRAALNRGESIHFLDVHDEGFGASADECALRRIGIKDTKEINVISREL